MNKFFSFLILFSFISLANATQQNLDYCVTNLDCSVGDFVLYNNNSVVTADCCNASAYFVNGTAHTSNTVMTGVASGFHNASFNFTSIGYYPIEMRCNCSDEFLFQSLDALVVIPVNYTVSANITVTANVTTNVTTVVNVTNTTANASDIWSFNNRTLTDNNQSLIFSELADRKAEHNALEDLLEWIIVKIQEGLSVFVRLI